MVMRRILPMFVLVFVLLLGIVGLHGSPAVRAQDATPASDDMSMEGLTFTLLGIAPSVSMSPTVDLQVARAEFEPGAGFPFDASDPVGVLVIIESGTLTMRVDEQPWHVSRGAALQQAMSGGEMEPDMTGVMVEIPAGTEGIVEAGDVAHVPGNLTGEVRNNSDQPASALLVLMDPGMMNEGVVEATPAG
jgi:quercetin dioxygenase-like cupin family protein